MGRQGGGEAMGGMMEGGGEIQAVWLTNEISVGVTVKVCMRQGESTREWEGDGESVCGRPAPTALHA